jgi:hypothetical protein
MPPKIDLFKAPVLPRRALPTPFGKVYLPEQKIGLPKLPPVDEKSMNAMKHAVAIDASMVLGWIPVVGDVVADVVEDLHAAELRKALTPRQYDVFEKNDKVAPAIVATARALTE